MSGFIQEEVDRKLPLIREGKLKAYLEEIDTKNYTGEQLEKDLRELRSVEKPNNWFMWMRVHSGRGVAATWKDHSFWKSLVLEIPKSRSAPWVLSGISTYIFGYLLFKVPKSEIANSINFYPHGNPPGSKLNDHYAHLVDVDIGTPVAHTNRDTLVKQTRHAHH
jgi:hypothetical protein